MRRRAPLAIVLGSLSLAVLVGCQASGPPVPPTPVNAALGKQVQLCDYRQPTAQLAVPAGGEPAPAGVTRIQVRVRAYAEFAQRPKDKNWGEHWFVVTCDVLKVERGAWPDGTLSFVTMDLGPTPESGITLGKVWLHQPGAEFLFELDTRSRPATIVGQAVLPSLATQSVER